MPKNLGLLELIRAKREWDWKPSLDEVKQGFRGWHQRGYLPQAWVIMPNHVHLVVDVWGVPLVKLIIGWKAKYANRELSRPAQRGESRREGI